SFLATNKLFPYTTLFRSGVPMSKALEDETLIAWAMNDEDIPLLNGHPLRLVCGGWPASTSGKWLKKIVVRDKVHDGNKMAAPARSEEHTSELQSRFELVC